MRSPRYSSRSSRRPEDGTANVIPRSARRHERRGGLTGPFGTSGRCCRWDRAASVVARARSMTDVMFRLARRRGGRLADARVERCLALAHRARQSSAQRRKPPRKAFALCRAARSAAAPRRSRCRRRARRSPPRAQRRASTIASQHGLAPLLLAEPLAARARRRSPRSVAFLYGRCASSIGSTTRPRSSPSRARCPDRGTASGRLRSCRAPASPRR